MNPQPGDLVDGKYRIVRRIGDGGMGSVYEARHELLGIPVALKFLHADLAKRPGLSARFLQEARVSATIASPHVARVTDVDTTNDGSPFIVMELLSGESLQSLLNRRGKLAIDEAVDFALQVLAGLEAAHAMGVVHRDLKPDNVFITPTSTGPLIKLIDFGIAKLKESSEYKKEVTRVGVIMGTPEYMAPEQLYAAHEVDHRADLYSLGVMLFEMLSGARPADGDTAEAIVASVISGNVKRLSTLEPTLPPSLVRIVERALLPDREQRFATAHAMRVELANTAGELSPAGRLAATPAPIVPEPAPPLPEHDKVPDTVDSPPIGIADTLPPEAPAVRAATGTQAALPPAVAQAAWSPPAVARPPGRAPRRRRRSAFWLVGIVTVLGIGAAAAAVVWEFMPNRRVIPDLPAPDIVPASSSEGPIVITPLASAAPDSPQSTAAAPARPTPVARPPAPTTPPVVVNPPPAGTATAGTTTTPLPFPSFALPSSLPPLPSALPTALPPGFPTALPSFLPAIPGLTIPPAQPPASNSAK